jgi:hypothetical protein
LTIKHFEDVFRFLFVISGYYIDDDKQKKTMTDAYRYKLFVTHKNNMSTKGKSKGTKGMSKSKGTKGMSKSKGTKGMSKSKGTKGMSKRTKTSEKGEQGPGMLRGGAEVGVEKGGQTLGKLGIGGEVGVEKDEQGSGKIKAGVNIGLESDTLYEIKEAAGDTMDDIKSGFKAAGKKLKSL